MPARIHPLSVEDVAALRSIVRYALEMAVEGEVEYGDEVPFSLRHIVEKGGNLIGLSDVEVELREARLRLGK